jgi:hypothetical protein
MNLSESQRAEVERLATPATLAQIKQLQEGLRARLVLIGQRFFEEMDQIEDADVRACVAIAMNLEVRAAADDFWRSVQALLARVEGQQA